MITSLIVLVAVIIGCSYWPWSQGQYYAGADSKGMVVIYQGIQQRIAWTSLSKPYRVAEIRLA